MPNSRPVLAFRHVEIGDALPLDFVVHTGELYQLRDCTTRLAEQVIQLACGQHTPEHGEVFLCGLPVACWPMTELHRQLRVIQPIARQFIGVSTPDVRALHAWPSSLRCLVFAGVLDALQGDARRVALERMQNVVRRRNIAALLLDSASERAGRNRRCSLVESTTARTADPSPGATASPACSAQPRRRLLHD